MRQSNRIWMLVFLLALMAAGSVFSITVRDAARLNNSLADPITIPENVSEEQNTTPIKEPGITLFDPAGIIDEPFVNETTEIPPIEEIIPIALNTTILNNTVSNTTESILPNENNQTSNAQNNTNSTVPSIQPTDTIEPIETPKRVKPASSGGSGGAINTPGTRATNENTAEKTIVMTQNELEQYRDDLHLPETHPVLSVVAKQLIELKRKNKERYESITQIAGIAEDITQTEELAKELVSMDALFVSKFSTQLKKDGEHTQVRTQISDYMRSLEEHKTLAGTQNPQPSFRKETIEKMFSKQVTYDDIVAELFG